MKKNSPTPDLTTEPVMKNRVAALCDASGVPCAAFVGYCYARGMKELTARRLFAGDTNFRTSTVAKAALILGVDIGDVIQLAKAGK